MRHMTTQPQRVITHAQQSTVQRSHARRMREFLSSLHKSGSWEIRLGISSSVICVMTLCLDCDCSAYDYCNDFYTVIAQGIWCGSLFIASGAVGVYSKLDRRSFVVNVVMSLISLISATVLIVLTMFALVEAHCRSIFTCHIILLVIGFATLICSIKHLSVARSGLRCLETSNSSLTMTPQQSSTGDTLEVTTIECPAYAVEPPLSTVTIGTDNPAMDTGMPDLLRPVGVVLESTTAVEPPAYTVEPPLFTVTTTSTGTPNPAIDTGMPDQLLPAGGVIEFTTVEPPAYSDLPPMYTE